MSKVIGQQKQWQFLKKSAELNRLSHAYLFFGPPQVGKKTIAIEFLKSLFCETKRAPAEQACQACRTCQGIEKNFHPDLLLIAPQRSVSLRSSTSAKASADRSASKEEIKISQIRELNWKLSLRPYSGPLKAAIINDAHLMNSESQNCLLKTLEEPKGKTVLILVTERPEALFPTILSRVQKIRFPLVPKTEIESHLRDQGASLKEIQKIASSSFGRPGLAIDFLLDTRKLESYDQRIKEMIKISQSDFGYRFQYVKNLVSQKQKLKEILDIWLRYLRGILLIKSGAYPASVPQEFILKQYSLDSLKKIIQTIERINFLISTTNINQKLALEQLILEL